MPEARPSEEIGLRKLPFAVAPAVPDVRLGGLAPWRISRLQAFVEEHLSQSIHIADLSGAVGLSVPHFARAFGRSFGEPPHLYVIQRRLDRARRLMLTSDMALSELAVACGFNDQAHFCRLFRRHTGERRQLGVVSGVMRSGLTGRLRRCLGSLPSWPTKAWKVAGPLQLEAGAPYDHI
jgi:AraC-like DNA-binding protein